MANDGIFTYNPRAGLGKLKIDGAGNIIDDNYYFNTGITTNANKAVDTSKSLITGDLKLDNTSPTEPSMWDTFGGYFNPNEKGVSQAGSVMDTIGSGIKGAVGLGSLYFAKKNYDLEKDQQEYLKDIDKQNSARASKFAANAGNNASY